MASDLNKPSPGFFAGILERVLIPLKCFLWQHKLLVVALVVWLLLYIPTWQTIIAEWRFNGGFGHGYLVLAYSIYLFFIQGRLPGGPPHIFSRLLGFGALIACLIAWLAASTIFVLTIEQLAWLGMGYSVVMIYFGFKWMLKHWIPLVMPILGIPFWAYLVLPLRDLSTFVSDKVLTVLGGWFDFSIFRDGYYIEIVSGRFHVEDACSGLSFLLTAVFVSLAFISMYRFTWRTSMVAILIAIAIALLSNWLRIIFIILAGQWFGMDHPIVADHLTFGWIVFGICLLPLLWLQQKLVRFHLGDTDPTSTPASLFKGRCLSAAIASVFIAMPVAYGIYQEKSQPIVYRPAIIDNMKPATSQVFWQPRFDGASEELSTRLTVAGEQITAYSAYYEIESPTNELIFVANQDYNDKRWSAGTTETVQVPGLGEAVYQEFNRGLDKVAILYWYDVGGKTTASKAQAKIAALSKRLQNITGSAYIGIGLGYYQGSKEANQALLIKAASQLLGASQ